MPGTFGCTRHKKKSTPATGSNVPNDLSSCPEASKLNSVCSEHDFLSCLKTRVALMMMHSADDYGERVTLSCGFSSELIAGIGKGIAFTCNPECAKGIHSDRFRVTVPVGARVFEQGKGHIIFSWVVIGTPYFTLKQVSGRQAGYTTHFALAHNGGFATLNGAALDTPILVSFAPSQLLSSIMCIHRRSNC